MTNQDILKRAQQHCFFIGVNDCGAELCKANSKYGMAGIHLVQEAIGIKPDATFITTPDMTITRNSTRWRSGFGYGGKITWGSGEEEFIILNAKPNACGMLVGGLYELPDAGHLIKKIHGFKNKKFEIDGIDLVWDFYKGNHFIDLFILKPLAKMTSDLPPYAFIIHGSAGELRTDDTPWGFGLYYDKSARLCEMAEKLQTPFGEFLFLTGENAKKYYELYRYADEFARKKRAMAAKELFGDYRTISNENHQGMISMNEMALGCNFFSDENHIYPITLRGDLPAYLATGKKNLAPETIDILGFEKRAKENNVYHRLTNLNIFPHGGGYNLPDSLSVNKVIEIDHERFFEIEMQNDRGKKIISDVNELPYDYRGKIVVLRTLEMGLVNIVGKLIPQYVLKI
ncbi:MAG: hypothetical protein JW969_11980 [Spirochaetales bacterium]|nr:hypothetical protein [Spirochaetales bacterium]